MKTLNKVVTVMAKIAEIVFWIGCGLVFAGLICSLFFGKSIMGLANEFIAENPTVSLQGLEIDLKVVGPYIMTALRILCFSGVITMALHAMIFRNINLIFRTAEGKTKFAKGASPFQPDIVRMVREIGIFCIAVPVVEFITSIVARIFIPEEFCEMSVSFTGILMGLVVLCLSQYFAYGAQLQKDVEGLV